MPIRAPTNEKPILKAITECRYDQGLELARLFQAAKPTPYNQAFCRNLHLIVARDLLVSDPKYAASVLIQAEQITGPLEFYENIARLYMQLDRFDLAERLLQDKIPNSPILNELLYFQVDKAVESGRKSSLPPALQPQFDAVIQAFEYLEAGRDELALSTIQVIGLTSPFLEWKLLIRGLVAYYNSDDTRAIENWSRLKLERLPARLATPLRVRIDSNFRKVQPPGTLRKLNAQFALLNDCDAGTALRQVMEIVNKHTGEMEHIFRILQPIVPELKSTAPEIANRILYCLAWIFVRTGQPKDVQKLAKVFGGTPDDPNLNRFLAIGYELNEDYLAANVNWAEFEKSLSASKNWPEPLKNKARARILTRIAENLITFEQLCQEAGTRLGQAMVNHFMSLHNDLPTIADTLKKAVALEPQWPTSSELLMRYLIEQNQLAEAREVGEKIYPHHPDRLSLVRLMCSIAIAQKDFEKAANYASKALSINPLERELRKLTGQTHREYALQLASIGEFSQARQEMDKAKQFLEGERSITLVAHECILEILAGQSAEAEKLQADFLTNRPEADFSLALTFLAECAALKQLPRSLKNQAEVKFNEYAKSCTSATALRLVMQTIDYYSKRLPLYRGFKTHQTKVMKLINQVALKDPTEESLWEFGEYLLKSKLYRAADTLAEIAAKRFRNSPEFPLIQVRALLEQNKAVYRAASYFFQAEKLTSQLAKGSRKDQLKSVLTELHQTLKTLNPYIMTFRKISNISDEQEVAEGSGA